LIFGWSCPGWRFQGAFSLYFLIPAAPESFLDLWHIFAYIFVNICIFYLNLVESIIPKLWFLKVKHWFNLDE